MIETHPPHICLNLSPVNLLSKPADEEVKPVWDCNTRLC